MEHSESITEPDIIVNHYQSTHHGEMPVRVLQHSLILEFEKMNPDFLDLSRKLIAEGKLDPGISYRYDKEKVTSPYVVGFGKIVLSEPFLSYIWCCTYSLTVLYSEVVVKKSKNDFFGNDDEKIDFALVEEAYQLWSYAVSLIDRYSDWNKSWPNPELHKQKVTDFINKVDRLYFAAVNFVLAHEFAHIELDHFNKTIPGLDANAQSKLFEKEADERAIGLVMAGGTEENNVTLYMGVLIGLCSLLFFSSKTKGDAYPDTDNRIDAIIELIKPEPQDAMWGMATLAYRLWDRRFDKKLVWSEGLYSPMELYYSIKAQV